MNRSPPHERLLVGEHAMTMTYSNLHTLQRPVCVQKPREVSQFRAARGPVWFVLRVELRE